MKKMFLRRALLIALCLLMVLPTFVINAFADSINGIPGDKSIIGNEVKNWAPGGMAYHTSVWNNDRHSKYLNNGTLGHSYQYWQPTDPQRPNGNGVDPTAQHFGVSFDNGYYLVDEIVIFADTWPKGQNNIKYEVNALILGEWKVVGVGYQDVSTITYRCDNCKEVIDWDTEMATDPADNTKKVCGFCGAKEDKVKQITGSGGSGSVSRIIIPLAHPDGLMVDKYKCSKCKTVYDEKVSSCTTKGCTGGTVKQMPDINTNNIMVKVSEYGAHAKRYGDYANKPATSHDWWITPMVQEMFINGVTGYRPEFDVPLNAYLVTNAALSGMLGATTKSTMRFAGMAGDNEYNTSWKAQKAGAQDIWAIFDQAYTIDNVGINVGGCLDADTGLTYTYNIKVLKSGTLEDGEWVTVVEGATAVTSRELEETIKHDLDAPMTVLGMKVELTSVKNASGRDARAVMTELWAEISEGKKCIFLADYMTAAKKISTATGNLACYGSPYASSNFSYASASKIPNIIDGNILYEDGAWIAADYLKDTYVGVTLKETRSLTKVVLYFNDSLGGTNGEFVFKYELQAKVNGEFVKVAEATTYDPVNKSYIISLVFDQPVVTDDIRVVFKSDAQTFPYLKEIEAFEGSFIYSSFDGYSITGGRKKGGPDATKNFAQRTVAVRGEYFSKISPLEYFNIAIRHDIQIDWLNK